MKNSTSSFNGASRKSNCLFSVAFVLGTAILLSFTNVIFAQTITIGTGTATTNGSAVDPIGDYYSSEHTQVLWTATELAGAGLPAGASINSLGFSVSQSPGALANYTIQMAHTTNATALTGYVTAGMSTVRTPFTYTPTVVAAGAFDMITFTSNFSWNGVDNIIIDFCTGSANPYATPYGGARYTTATGQTRARRIDGSSACAVAPTLTQNNRLNVQFAYIAPSGCTGLPTAATVVANSASGCNGGTFTLTGSGLEVGTGISHIWQSSTDDITFADIAGATAGSYSPAVLAGVTYYRLSTTCSNSALTNYSTSVSFEGFACGSVNLPATGSGNVVCGTNTFIYDSGGSAGVYASNSTGYIVLENSGTGVITISGSYEYLETNYDYLRIFSGAGTGGTSIAIYNGSAGGTIATFSSSPGESITIQLTSDAIGQGQGFEIAAVYSGTCAACSGLPTALTASGLNGTGGTLSWTAPSPVPSDGYDIFLGPNGGSAPGAGTSPTLQTLSGTDVDEDISGLTAETDYEFWVRSDCGSPDGVSSWVGPFAFSTVCASITTLPHTETFGTYLPSTCWFEGDDGDLTAGPSDMIGYTASWTADGFLNSGFAGAVRNNIGGIGDNEWLISPAFDLPATPDQRVKYSVGATNANSAASPANPWESDDYVEVLVATGADAYGFTNWTVLNTYDDSNTPSSTGQIDSESLAAYAGQTVRFAFRAVEGVSNGTGAIDFHFDNFVIEEIPSCLAPSAVTASAVTATSATISWTAPAPAPGTGYDYYVSTSSTDPTSGSTPTGQTVGADVDDVLTVSSGTTYYYWVRSDCGSGDVSSWVGPGTFATPPTCPITNATYCYENSTTEWVNVLVVTPGDYLDITFNSGSVENTYDELLVYDGADGTGTQLYFGYGASGNISGLTYQSTTGVISFAVQGDNSNSCGSSGQTQIDYS